MQMNHDLNERRAVAMTAKLGRGASQSEGKTTDQMYTLDVFFQAPLKDGRFFGPYVNRRIRFERWLLNSKFKQTTALVFVFVNRPDSNRSICLSKAF